MMEVWEMDCRNWMLICVAICSEMLSHLYNLCGYILYKYHLSCVLKIGYVCIYSLNKQILIYGSMVHGFES